VSRYYFHIIDGSQLIPDDEGMELPSLEAAWDEANMSVADLERASIQSGTALGASGVEFTDEDGNLLGCVDLVVRRLA